MGTTLSGKKPGAPNNTFGNLLHNHNTTFATGSRIALGEGTDTGLVLWGDSIGVHNGTAAIKLTSSASAAITINFPDDSGNVVLDTGAGISDLAAFQKALGYTVEKLAADVSTTSDTLADVAGFSFAPEVSSTYRFEIMLRLESAADTNGVKLALEGPTADFVTYSIESSYGTESTDQFYSSTYAAFGGVHDSSYLIQVSGVGLARIRGIVKFPAGAPASNVRIQYASEAAATAVGVLEGSVMQFWKM